MNHREIDALWGLAQEQCDAGVAREAAATLRKILDLDPRDADAWHALGFCEEQLGRTDAARKAFGRVWSLDQRRMAREAPRMNHRRFNKLVEQAISELDGPVRDALDEVALLLEDYPGRWILETELMDPRLLGLFDGPTWAELRSTAMEAAPQYPPTLYLFQRNLEWSFPDDAELVEEIAVTLYHELGHFLGLSEDDLHARGLD
jgi:predicted Zn-dependent protease with MMP-like domain